MSTFYINGENSLPNSYQFHEYYGALPLVDPEILEKKKSYDRYIYSSFVESSKKTNKTNESLKSDSNINLYVSSNINKCFTHKGFKN